MSLVTLYFLYECWVREEQGPEPSVSPGSSGHDRAGTMSGLKIGEFGSVQWALGYTVGPSCPVLGPGVI